MSTETVQFVEMVRKAYIPYLTNEIHLHFCASCGCQKPHRINDRGLDEIYQCQSCGHETSYRVR